MKFKEVDRIIIKNLNIKGQIISIDDSIISRRGGYYVNLFGQGVDDFPEHHNEYIIQYYRKQKLNKIENNGKM